MSRFKRIAVHSGLVLLPAAMVLHVSADNQLNGKHSTYHVENAKGISPYTVHPHHPSSEYLIPDDSGIFNIEHTAFAVIRLKRPLPTDIHLSLNGEEVNVQKVDTTGTILKIETNNLKNQWLEITGSQIYIRHLLTFRDL